jgi:hypothetical protein
VVWSCAVWRTERGLRCPSRRGKLERVTAPSALRRSATGLACALALSSSLQACLVYEAGRAPNWVASQSLPTAGESPRIGVTLRHRLTVDGAPPFGIGGQATADLLRESFERVRAETPLLAAADFASPDPALVLEIDTEVAERGAAGVFLAGLSFGLLPAITTSELTLRAALSDAAGTPLGAYQASSSTRSIGHLLLLPALPLLLSRPGQRIADDTFRDLFLQLAPELAQRSGG